LSHALLLSIGIVKLHIRYYSRSEIRQTYMKFRYGVLYSSDIMMVVVLVVHCVVADIHLVPTACSLVEYLKYVIRCIIGTNTSEKVPTTGTYTPELP
jgi:hypothetical protein